MRNLSIGRKNAPVTGCGVFISGLGNQGKKISSGVGFVNCDTVKKFTVNAPIPTYGLGARGYNQYDGTVENILFLAIETFRDCSIGIQISKPIASLPVNGNVTTHGSIGSSLVKGMYFDLPAYALSIKNGGAAKSITIKGNVETNGDNVISYIKEKGGNPGSLNIDGKIIANGQNSQEKKIE